MRVSELMTKTVLTARPEMHLKDAARIMSKHSISGLPVVDDEYRVTGIITEGDFVSRAGAQSRVSLLDTILGRDLRALESETVGDVMQRRVHTVSGSALHGFAAVLMQKKGVKRLPVVDEDGKLSGIISRSDILKVFTRTDEAIRSDILDHVVGQVVRPDSEDLAVEVEDGTVRLSGTVATRTESLLLCELSTKVDGVMGIDSKLRYLVDDTHRSSDMPQFGMPRPNW